MSFHVYILKCRDGSYYVGHTDNLSIRLAEHQQAKSPTCYTAKRLPVHMVFQQPFETRYESLLAERSIKGWRRAKKEALIAGDWEEIKRLSNLKPTQNSP